MLTYNVLILAVCCVYVADTANNKSNATCLKKDYLFQTYHEAFNSDEKIPSDSYPCLGMYDPNNVYKLVNGTEFFYESSFKCAYQNAGNLITDLMETTKQKMKPLGDTCLNDKTAKLRVLINEIGNKLTKSLLVTCPLGLLYDRICVGCLDPQCLSQKHSCTEHQDIAFSQLCKDERDSLLDICINATYCDTKVGCYYKKLKKATVDLVSGRGLEPGSSNACKEINLIYQGLASLQAIKRDIISVHCSHTNGSVHLNCYKKGAPLSRGSWEVVLKTEAARSSTEFPLKLDIGDLEDIADITCYDDEDGSVATLQAEQIEVTCEAVTANDTNEDEGEIVPEDPPEGPTLESNTMTTAPGPNKCKPEKCWKDFYQTDWIWRPTNFTGMDAFENPARLNIAEGQLCVAEVSIFGRFTPVCGHKWNKVAAEVFCRDAGKQVDKTWFASHFGVVDSSLNPKISEFYYRHYMRNVECTGEEDKFVWCRHTGWYEHQCQHDAVVVCSAVPEPGPPHSYLPYIIVTSVVVVLVVAIVVILLLERDNKRFTGVLRKLRFYSTKGARTGSGTDQSTIGISLGTVSERADPSVPGSAEPGFPPTNQLSMDQTLSSAYPTGTFEHLPVGSGVTNSGVTGRAVKRLNPSYVKEIVLLFESDGSFGTVVCKSFENNQRGAGVSSSDILSEKDFLEQCDHPNIIKYLKQYPPTAIDISNLAEEDNRQKLHKPLVFFMEYLKLGNLYEYLQKSPGDPKRRFDCNGEAMLDHESGTPMMVDCNGHMLKEYDATNMIKGGSHALQYVHDIKGYLHGDISADNFLVFFNDDVNLLDLKLGDFGSFYPATAKVDDMITKVRNSARYTAPEFILKEAEKKEAEKKEAEKKKQTLYPKTTEDILRNIDAKKNDIWGWGLIIWEIASWVCCPGEVQVSKKVHRDVSEDIHKNSKADEDDPMLIIEDPEDPEEKTFIEPRYALFNEGFENVRCKFPLFRHVALLQQLNNQNSACCDERPTKEVMLAFYGALYPNQVPLPEMHANIDGAEGIFKWNIKDCIRGCLELNPEARWDIGKIVAIFTELEKVKREYVQPNLDLQQHPSESFLCFRAEFEPPRTKQCSVM